MYPESQLATSFFVHTPVLCIYLFVFFLSQSSSPTFKMPQCDLSPNGTHRYVPSPTTLSSVTCLHCHHTKLCTKAKCASKYLKYRRSMQHCRGLRNISVCLEVESAQSLQDVLVEAGIKSKVPGPSSSGGGAAPSYVTLLEGVLPESNENLVDRDAPLVVDQEQLQCQIDALRTALKHHPTITVRKLHKIRRTDRTTDLLLADVTLNPAISKCLSALAKSDNCVLPQYPCYIALGSVSREGRVSVNALKSIRKLLQGHSLKVRDASLQCRSLSSSSPASGAASGASNDDSIRRGSFASHGYGRHGNSKYFRGFRMSSETSRDPQARVEYSTRMQYVQEQTFVPQYQPTRQSHPCMELSPDAAPFKLQYQPNLVRSASNKSAATLDTECEHTACLSESSDSDNDGSGDDYKLSTPTKDTGGDVYINDDKIISFDSMPLLTSSTSSDHLTLGNPITFGRSGGHFAVGKNPSMDEADLACDLNFLADTPPSSPGRPGPGNSSNGAETSVGIECILDECRQALQIIGM